MWTRLRGPGSASVRRRLLLAATVALVVALLAGCTADPGGAGPDENETLPDAESVPADSDDATERSNESADGPEADEVPTLASVGVDANATWNRTLALLDVDAERPPVSVRSTTPPSFLGIETTEYVSVFAGEELDARAAAWYNPRSEAVTIRAEAVEEQSPSEVEAVLAHEYAHAVQFQHGWDAPNRSAASSGEPLVRTIYFEGMASYVQSEYGRTYLSNSSEWAPENRSAGDAFGERFAVAPYVEGARYYDQRLQSPQQVTEVVDDPPTTSEQVLHGVEDDPRSLSVDVEYDVRNVSATYGTPRGELATREILRSAIEPERAAAAAAGWGTDELLTFHDPGRDQRGYVWVHRWDDAAKAEEFERAAGELVEQRRAESDDYEFDRRRLAPETTAVVAGTGGFLDDVSTEAAGNESVTVSV